MDNQSSARPAAFVPSASASVSAAAAPAPASSSAASSADELPPGPFLLLSASTEHLRPNLQSEESKRLSYFDHPPQVLVDMVRVTNQFVQSPGGRFLCREYFRRLSAALGLQAEVFGRRAESQLDQLMSYLLDAGRSRFRIILARGHPQPVSKRARETLNPWEFVAADKEVVVAVTTVCNNEAEAELEEEEEEALKPRFEGVFLRPLVLLHDAWVSGLPASPSRLAGEDASPRSSSLRMALFLTLLHEFGHTLVPFVVALYKGDTIEKNFHHLFRTGPVMSSTGTARYSPSLLPEQALLAFESLEVRDAAERVVVPRRVLLESGHLLVALLVSDGKYAVLPLINHRDGPTNFVRLGLYMPFCGETHMMRPETDKLIELHAWAQEARFRSFLTGALTGDADLWRSFSLAQQVFKLPQLSPSLERDIAEWSTELARCFSLKPRGASNASNAQSLSARVDFGHMHSVMEGDESEFELEQEDYSQFKIGDLQSCRLSSGGRPTVAVAGCCREVMLKFALWPDDL